MFYLSSSLLWLSLLGWYLYFSLALRIGSPNWLGFTHGAWYGGMFKLDTTFEKKSFRVDEISSSSFNNNSFSISVILEKDAFLSEKKGFTVLQKDLLSERFIGPIQIITQIIISFRRT